MAGTKRDNTWAPGAEGRLLRAWNYGVEMEFLVERFGRDGAAIRDKLAELAAGGVQVRGFEAAPKPAPRRAGSYHMRGI